MNYGKKLNTYFRALRKRLGLSQVQVSKIFGLSDSKRISALENEISDPKLDLIIAYHLLSDTCPSEVIPEAYRREAKKILYRVKHFDCLGEPSCEAQRKMNQELIEDLVGRLETKLNDYEGEK